MNASNSKASRLAVNNGLEGVVVAATAICDVRGKEGDLRYRGRSIDYWVEQDFASAAAAVLGLESLGIKLDLAQTLFNWGELSVAESKLVQDLVGIGQLHPMAILQSVVPLLETGAAQELAKRKGWIRDTQLEALTGVVIAAKLPQIIALLTRSDAASAYPNEPDYSARFLHMLGIAEPTALQLRALTVTQILQLEHSLNAGTFAARVVASTQASLAAALSGALGALSGALHGGADQAAIEMADEVGQASAAQNFVAQALASKTKVMGMGHREYKVIDPRAIHVKRLAEALAKGTPHAATFATLAAVEAAFSAEMSRKNRALHANLEFYKGVVYRALGVPDSAFTAVFAMARVFGYVAHVLESRHDARIIRPAAVYVGERQGMGQRQR